MKEQSYEVIKTRTFFLKEGQISDEIVLVDNNGGDGDMYFTFRLEYIKDEDKEGNTTFNVKDEHHASMIIETKPYSFTRFGKPLEIGTYQKIHKLYIGVTVEPCINCEEGQHRVTVTFYTNRLNK